MEHYIGIYAYFGILSVLVCHLQLSILFPLLSASYLVTLNFLFCTFPLQNVTEAWYADCCKLFPTILVNWELMKLCWESWQLVTAIHDEGNGLILCE
jgi:hypothetical protein